VGGFKTSSWGYNMEERRENTDLSRDLDTLKENFEAGINPLAYIPYAEALHGRGMLPQALDVCNKGLMRDSYSVTGRTLLAKILFAMGRYENALEELGTVLQTAPDAFGANLLMVKILARKREYHEAMDIVQNLKKMNASDRELLQIEEMLHTKIFSMETRGDISRPGRQGEGKGVTLDDRINELLEHLRSFSGVIRFDLSKVPKKEDGIETDPGRDFFSKVNQFIEGKEMGDLKQVMIEMRNGSLLLFRIEDSLLKVVTEPEVNMGKLRLQVENLLKPS